MNTARKTRIAAIAALVVALTLPVRAAAEEAADLFCSAGEENRSLAKKLYKTGRRAFERENYRRAVAYFETAYSCLKSSALLFNIAQAQRRAGDTLAAYCQYREYLDQDDVSPSRRSDVELALRDLIAELREDPDVRFVGELPSCAPEPVSPPVIEPAITVPVVVDTLPAPKPMTTRPSPPRDPILYATLGAGPSFFDMGGLEVAGAQFTIDLGVGHPIDVGRFGLDLGAQMSVTPVSWHNDAGVSGTSSLVGILASVGTRLRLSESLTVRTDLSAGVLVLAGLSDGNVFMAGARPMQEPLALPSARASLGLQYAITPSLLVHLVPAAISYTHAKDRLRTGIDRLTRLDVSLGLGWRI